MATQAEADAHEGQPPTPEHHGSPAEKQGLPADAKKKTRGERQPEKETKTEEAPKKASFDDAKPARGSSQGNEKETAGALEDLSTEKLLSILARRGFSLAPEHVHGRETGRYVAQYRLFCQPKGETKSRYVLKGEVLDLEPSEARRLIEQGSIAKEIITERRNGF